MGGHSSRVRQPMENLYECRCVSVLERVGGSKGGGGVVVVVGGGGVWVSGRSGVWVGG